MMNHIGIYLSNEVNKDLLIDSIFSNDFLERYIDLSGMHGELYSTTTIDRIIDEELRHDRFPITTDENPSLLSMSSGQRRKALLSYLLAQQPQYLVLDDLFSSIDEKTHQFIIATLNECEKSIILIQIFYRKQDILPYIQTVISVDHQNRILSDEIPTRIFSQPPKMNIWVFHATNKNKLYTHESKEHFITSRSAAHHIQNLTLPHLFADQNDAINPLIQINSISAQYGEKKVLKNISWTIQSGEFWQLTGPIGSGKSTLLSMIIGDNPRGFGQDMILFGRRKGTGESIWDIKKRIGYFTPSMTLQFTHRDSVEEMIISGFFDSIGLYRKPTGLQREMADSWLQVLGPSFRGKSFNLLSFGQQRILLVVRAMVKHPPLLILDEPTVGLDDENTQLFIEMINAIASQHKVSIIYVSHRLETGLKPNKIYQLEPSPEGSSGTVRII